MRIMLNKQTGFSFGSLLIWFIIGGFILLIGMKLIPLYIENRTIQSVLNEMKEEQTTGGLLSVRDVRGRLDRQLLIDGIRRFDNKDSEMNIKRVNDTIVVEYEVREHIISNIDLVVSFSNSVDLPVQ
jgi:hypothetical protein